MQNLRLHLRAFLFGAIPFAHIPHNSAVYLVSSDFDLRDRGFDRELGSIRPQSGNDIQLSHRPAGSARPTVGFHVMAMAFSETSRNKTVQRRTNSFRRRTTEHLLSRGIENDDALFFIDADDRIHRGADNSIAGD